MWICIIASLLYFLPIAVLQPSAAHVRLRNWFIPPGGAALVITYHRPYNPSDTLSFYTYWNCNFVTPTFGVKFEKPLSFDVAAVTRILLLGWRSLFYKGFISASDWGCVEMSVFSSRGNVVQSVGKSWSFILVFTCSLSGVHVFISTDKLLLLR